MRMPAAFAASRIIVPEGTVTCRPSIVSVTEAVVVGAVIGADPSLAALARDDFQSWSGHRCWYEDRGAPLLDQRLEVAAELVDARRDRRRAGVAEHADGLAGHLLADIQ